MTQIVVGHDVSLKNGVINNILIVTSNITITSTTGTNGTVPYVIGVNTSSSSITITLPTTSSNGMELGRTYIIYDHSGNSNVNNIVINANGDSAGGTINGSNTMTINQNYASYTIICSSSSTPIKWSVI